MNQDNRKNAHQEIDHIFKELLPAHGMAERPAQVDLSHRMLDAMLDGSIALCDAGTGIGKTYAYLVAGTVFLRCRAAAGLPFHPLLISTSSIALQNAVLNEYLPFLSAVLMAGQLMDHPLRAVVRKGKAHYVCDERLRRRLGAVDLGRKSPRAREALLSLRDHLDLDMAEHLSGRSVGRRPLLPEHSALIVDEAHKLPEAARQMFGVTLTAGDLRSLIHELRGERYLLAAETLAETAGPLLRELSLPWDGERPFSHFASLLKRPRKTLELIQRQISALVSHSTRRQLEQIIDKVTLFLRSQPDVICYAAEDDRGGTMLCATVSDLTEQFRQTLGRQRTPMLLTSGTMAVGRDFRRFKEDTGLLTDSRVRESVAPSPFAYSENCLLYLPHLPPCQDSGRYYEKLAKEISALLDAAHGHALVLFTSYAAMSAVKERLRDRGMRYPLFPLGLNAVHTTGQFKSTPGSVLLATGAAWEGFDFPGNCVSLLVIPRLPFPMPDALKEKERERYPDLHSFLRAVVVPEMQIKLKQGFGRAIRTETDTCVVAILDERAVHGRRYFRDIVTALPEMPVTNSIQEVERFIRAVKPDSYFQEGVA